VLPTKLESTQEGRYDSKGTERTTLQIQGGKRAGHVPLRRPSAGDGSNQRLAEIERDAAVLRAIRDDSEIRAKSDRLAKAIIAAIEHKPEKVD
jgi:hypothetical protein